MEEGGKKGVNYTLTYRDVVDILRVVKESAYCERFDLELDGLRLCITRFAGRESRAALNSRNAKMDGNADLGSGGKIARNAPEAHKAVLTSADSGPGEGAKIVTVTAPTVGTFYRASSPGATPFVNIGDSVKPNFRSFK